MKTEPPLVTPDKFRDGLHATFGYLTTFDLKDMLSREAPLLGFATWRFDDRDTWPFEEKYTFSIPSRPFEAWDCEFRNRMKQEANTARKLLSYQMQQTVVKAWEALDDDDFGGYWAQLPDWQTVAAANDLMDNNDGELLVCGQRLFRQLEKGVNVATPATDVRSELAGFRTVWGTVLRSFDLPHDTGYLIDQNQFEVTLSDDLVQLPDLVAQFDVSRPTGRIRMERN